MIFTKEQVLNFSTNWKIYQANNKHKKKAIVQECPYRKDSSYWYEPFTYYKSDLTFAHHVMYNWLRNLPLDRGMKIFSEDTLNEHKKSLRSDLWAFQNYFHHSKTNESYKERFEIQYKKFTDVFGNNLTTEMIMQFYSELKS